jgi:hypothetical protein
MSATFDTRTYAKKLKAAGFTEQQAEGQSEALRAVIDENLATKADRAACRADLQRDLKELEQRITIRLGGLVVGATAVLAVLIGML